MIKIRNLKKTYRRGSETVVACQVDALDVEAGEQIAIIGRSGLGKTTLLNMIAGILRPDSGTLIVAGQDMASLGESGRDRFRGRTIGMVFQTLNLLQPFTAIENVLLGAVFAGGSGQVVKDRALQLLTRVGLGDRTGHRPSELSLGQAQRVALCRALINQPKLLLADEPLGNQDKTTGREVLRLMLEMAKEDSATVLMVTHDPESATAMQRTVDLADLAPKVMAGTQ